MYPPGRGTATCVARPARLWLLGAGPAARQEVKRNGGACDLVAANKVAGISGGPVPLLPHTVHLRCAATQARELALTRPSPCGITRALLHPFMEEPMTHRLFCGLLLAL